MKIYSLFDKDANMCDITTFNVPTDEVAKRVISNSLDTDVNLKKHHKSYKLVCLGEYDREKGITADGTIRTVCEVSDLLSMTEPAPQAPSAEQTIKGDNDAPTSRYRPTLSNRSINMEKDYKRINKLRHIKYILKEYTKGLIPINQIAESCLMTNMPDETVHELGEKIYEDMHTQAR